MRLKHKTAVVTGAASGIGKEIAVAFSSEGANVIYSDVEDLPDFQSTDSAHFVQCDVSNKEEVEKLIGRAVSLFGKIDIMVNNAGVGTMGSITDTDDETWGKTMAVNLFGTFYGTRAAARTMKENGVRGSIINMSSILGKVGLAGTLAYSTSKGGVVQLTHAAALDLADAGVRVNAIAPGFIKTNMTKKVQEDQNFLSMVEENTPLGHMGEVRDIAYAALYLASDESRYVTGEVMYVDGGWTAR